MVHIKRDIPLLVFAMLVPIVVIVAIAFQSVTPAHILLRDPIVVAATANECCAPHFGAVSNLGIIGWSIGCFSVLMAAGVIQANPAPQTAPLRLPFLWATGAITLIFMLDDLFLLHEWVLPGLGVPEILVLGGYGAVFLAYAVCFRRFIVRSHFVFFFVACCLFATSILIDLIIGAPPILLEDGAKFMGIFAWSGFAVLNGVDALRAWQIAPPKR